MNPLYRRLGLVLLAIALLWSTSLSSAKRAVWTTRLFRASPSASALRRSASDLGDLLARSSEQHSKCLDRKRIECLNSVSLVEMEEQRRAREETRAQDARIQALRRAVLACGAETDPPDAELAQSLEADARDFRLALSSHQALLTQKQDRETRKSEETHARSTRTTELLRHAMRDCVAPGGRCASGLSLIDSMERSRATLKATHDENLEKADSYARRARALAEDADAFLARARSFADAFSSLGIDLGIPGASYGARLPSFQLSSFPNLPTPTALFQQLLQPKIQQAEVEIQAAQVQQAELRREMEERVPEFRAPRPRVDNLTRVLETIRDRHERQLESLRNASRLTDRELPLSAPSLTSPIGDLWSPLSSFAAWEETMESLTRLGSLAIVLDTTARVLHSLVYAKKKLWDATKASQRARIPVPLVDSRAGFRPIGCKSPTQLVGWLLLHPNALKLFLSFIALILVWLTLRAYAPMYRDYERGCGDEEASRESVRERYSGTSLTRNLRATARAYSASSNRLAHLERQTSILTKMQSVCSENSQAWSLERKRVEDDARELIRRARDLAPLGNEPSCSALIAQLARATDMDEILPNRTRMSFHCDVLTRRASGCDLRCETSTNRLTLETWRLGCAFEAQTHLHAARLGLSSFVFLVLNLARILLLRGAVRLEELGRPSTDPTRLVTLYYDETNRCIDERLTSEEIARKLRSADERFRRGAWLRVLAAGALHVAWLTAVTLA